jgi:signal transduction histidine kinase
MEAVQAFWRRFAASVTDFARRVRQKPSARTEAAIMLLQSAFALTIIIFIAIDYLHSLDLVIVIGVILAVTAIFSYLIVQVALRPTQQALIAQKQFIGNIAHELRTPLSIIRTNTEVRLFDTDIPDEVRDMHTSNLGELDRISNIINNLLSLSTFVDPGRMPFTNVDLGAIVRTAIGHLENFAEHKRLAFIVEESQNRVVWGNESALEQIVMNILKNALSYTREGGPPIRVRITPSDKGLVQLTIADRGMGIPENELSRIVEPFYRGDVSRRRGDGGSGLGLTIVTELLKLLRGQMDIRSAPHVGTTVTITLPEGHTSLPLHSA